MYSWQRFFSHPVGYLCWVFPLLCKSFVISWCLTCEFLWLFPVILESLSESFCLCLYLKETQNNKHLYSMNSRDGLFALMGFDLPQLLLALYYIAFALSHWAQSWCNIAKKLTLLEFMGISWNVAPMFFSSTFVIWSNWINFCSVWESQIYFI